MSNREKNGMTCKFLKKLVNKYYQKEEFPCKMRSHLENRHEISAMTVVHKNSVLYNSQTFQYPIKLQNPVMLWIPDNRIVGSTTTEVISNTFVL